MFNNFIAIFALIMSVKIRQKIPDIVALLRALSNPLWIFLFHTVLLFLVSEMAPTVQVDSLS